MSAASNTIAKKEQNYALLAHNLDRLAREMGQYQELVDKMVQQHKAMSSMAIWHVSQFMAVSRLVDNETEPADPHSGDSMSN